MRQKAYVLVDAAAKPVRVGVFDIDVSPPIGSPLAYDRTISVETPLSCRGIVLLSAEKPIVLCAIDWIGVGNEAHACFRENLAHAAATTADRVAVHALHQHDAPWYDFEIDNLMTAHEIKGIPFDSVWAHLIVTRARDAVQKAAASRRSRDAYRNRSIKSGAGSIQPATSGRRRKGSGDAIHGDQGSGSAGGTGRRDRSGIETDRVSEWRQVYRALTFYATHPQSYYRTGKANPDFPGLARNHRQAATGVPHIHFSGAGGNIGAGKYNDGLPANRAVLAKRMETAMAEAWSSLKTTSVSGADLGWSSRPITLPVSRNFDESDRRRGSSRCLRADNTRHVGRGRTGLCPPEPRGSRSKSGACGLATPGCCQCRENCSSNTNWRRKKLRPDVFVAMAAYGDYGPGYIGTAVAYDQGGYEVLPTSSFVAPEVEGIIMDALRSLLGAPAR